MIYAFYFFQTVDAFNHLLNDAVDLQVQAVDHHRNLTASGHCYQILATFTGIRSTQNGWGTCQNGWISASWPRFGKNGQSLLAGIWQFRPEWTASGLLAGFRHNWPNYDHLCWNLAT
jgi:hypothetical protein